MGRLLGIDYGEKRIGLALTDPQKIIASPFDVLERRDIDGLFVNYMGEEGSVQVAEYLGITPRYSDSTDLGGAAFDVASASEEVPCHNCHTFHDSWVLLFRDARIVVVLDIETFWDS